MIIIKSKKEESKAYYNNSPKYLQIELNNTCNANCLMCSIPKMERERGMMNEKLYDNILREAAQLEVSYILPFLHGEPFLVPNIISKLEKINELAPKSKIHLFTNASRLFPELTDQLSKIKNIDLLNFSFPGGTKEAYEEVTGLDYETSVANIKYALKKLNVPMKITMPLTNQNSDTVKEFNQIWKSFLNKIDKDVPFYGYKTYNYLGDFKESLIADNNNICDRLFESMCVLWDGRIGLCCMDVDGKFILGDFNKKSLFEIWNGKRAKSYRKRHIEGRENCYPCSVCNLDMSPERIVE